MGRQPRILLPKGIYHVYNRVSGAEHVLGDEDEADRWHLNDARVGSGII